MTGDRVPLLGEAAVAEWLGVRRATLADWRQAASGPPFVRLSAGTVRYDPAAVEEWLRSRAVPPGRAETPGRGRVGR